MFHTKVVHAVKTRILRSVTFFPRKSSRWWDDVGEKIYGRQATDGNTAHKNAIFMPNNCGKNTLTFVFKWINQLDAAINYSAVGRGRSGQDQTRPTALLPPRPYGKPEAAAAVDRLLMMGIRMPETCWAAFKRQAIRLRDWCIWLVDFF